MIAVHAAAAHAGAWTREPGSAYAKLGVDGYDAVVFVPPGATRPQPGTYLGGQANGYAEVGVVDRLQVSAAWGVVSGASRAEVSGITGDSQVRASTTRTGDLRLGTQVALHPTAPISAALDVKIPTYANGKVGAAFGQLAPLFPKPGDGQVDVTGWLHVGGAHGKAFGEASIGWRHRSEWFVGWNPAFELHDGPVAIAKGGVRVGRLLPILGLDGVFAARPNAYTRQSVTASAGALVDLIPDRLALEPRLAAELWTRAASRGYAGGLGVSWRR